MKKLQLTLAVGLTAVGTTFLLYYLHRRRTRNRLPTDKWQYAGNLEEIIMYPIKSCMGIELAEATCSRNGVQSNELWNKILLLVDDDGHIGFAGKNPQMWSIKPEIIGVGELRVTAPDMEPLHINLTEVLKGREEALTRVGKYQVPLIECDREINRWFSKFLKGKDTGMRLFVCLTPQPKKRLFRKNMDHNPFMVISDESVANLNSRLSKKVHHWQFRGNFLISTHLPAFNEDNWKWMRIGHDAIFRFKAPCYRCILPNIDPFTCERSQEFEPIRTLKTYRMKAGQVEPEMGIYFDLHQEGVVKRGDPVYVIT